MFSRWSKPRNPQPTVEVQELAKQLGIERRTNVRVRSPLIGTTLLPRFKAAGKILRLQDLSVGGCCLVDEQEILGPNVGSEFELCLEWDHRTANVNSRIVGRVDHKRHIQFLNLPDSWLTQIRKAMESGVRGLNMRTNLPRSSNGPLLEAREIWLSAQGDSLVFHDDILIRAEVTISQNIYRIYIEAWPTTAEGQTLSRDQFEAILLFLANVPQPSQLIKELVHDLERLHAEKFP